MKGFKEGVKYDRVLFVSEDDTYRGPVASALLRKHLPRGVPKVGSRGLIVLFDEPPNPKGVQILEEMGIDISNHRSKQLEDKDFREGTLVIMMTDRGKKTIYDRFENAGNVYTLRELAGEEGDVEMPYGKTIDEYKENLEYIKSLVDSLAELVIASSR